MHRFFVLAKNISANRIIIPNKEQFHHLKDVLRVKTGEEVAVFDERQNEYSCVIQELQKDQAILEIKSKSAPRIPEYKLTIACAIPKNVKMDEIVDKLTQLGVDRIIPLKTERVIVKLDKHKEILRLSRWRKIAKSASQQSQRNSLPIIESVKDIKEVVSDSKEYDLKIIPTLRHCEEYEGIPRLSLRGGCRPVRRSLGEGGRQPTKQSLKNILAGPKPKNILALIGPEGDFTPEEVELALKSGFIPATLGNLVLRVDTAAIAVASYIKLRCGIGDLLQSRIGGGQS